MTETRICPKCGKPMGEHWFLTESGAIVWRWHCEHCGHTEVE